MSSANSPPREQKRVRGKDAGAPGIGEDGKARSAGAWLLGQHFGHIEEVAYRAHAQNSGATKGGFEHLVAAGQRPGVGSGGLGGGVGASGLDDNDGLRERDLAGRADEGPGVSDGFHVEHDGVGAGVVAEVVDQVAPSHVEHGTHRDERAEADHLGDAPVENRGTERAALADEGDAAGTRNGLSPGGVESLERVHDADAVGTDDAHAASLEPLLDLVFELLPAFSVFAETGGNDDPTLHPGCNAIGDDVGNRCGRRSDDGQFNSFGHGRDRRICLDAQHIGVMRVDREDGAAKRIAEQSPEDIAANGVGALGSANHGHALWRENRVKRMAFGVKNVVCTIAGWLSSRLAGRLTGRRHSILPTLDAGSIRAFFRA